MTAREFLAAVQQRADAADSFTEYHYPGMQVLDSLGDVPRLVAALTSALDLADDPQRHKVALGHVDRDDLIAAITDALTPKENDS